MSFFNQRWQQRVLIHSVGGKEGRGDWKGRLFSHGLLVYNLTTACRKREIALISPAARCT